MHNVQNRWKTRNVNPPGADRPLESKHALKNVVIPLELPPAGHALLKTIAIEDGCLSVEQYILELILEECQAFTEAMADKDNPALQELFSINQEVPRL